MRKRKCKFDNDEVILFGLKDNKFFWLYPYYNNKILVDIDVTLFSNHSKPNHSKRIIEMISISNLRYETFKYKHLSDKSVNTLREHLELLRMNKNDEILYNIIRLFKPNKYVSYESRI